MYDHVEWDTRKSVEHSEAESFSNPRSFSFPHFQQMMWLYPLVPQVKVNNFAMRASQPQIRTAQILHWSYGKIETKPWRFSWSKGVPLCSPDPRGFAWPGFRDTPVTLAIRASGNIDLLSCGFRCDPKQGY